MCTRRIYDVCDEPKREKKRASQTHTYTHTHIHQRHTVIYTQKIGNKFAGFCVYLYILLQYFVYFLWLNVFCWFDAAAAGSTFLTYCSYSCDDCAEHFVFRLLHWNFLSNQSERIISQSTNVNLVHHFSWLFQ